MVMTFFCETVKNCYNSTRVVIEKIALEMTIFNKMSCTVSTFVVIIFANFSCYDIHDFICDKVKRRLKSFQRRYGCKRCVRS